MRTEQIIQLDCREAENKEIIQKVLKQIKPLSRCKDDKIPIENIERVIKVICTKYGFFLKVYPDCDAGDKCIVWRTEAYLRSNLKNIGNAYGCTIYESLAKITILLYSKVRKIQEERGQ